MRSPSPSAAAPIDGGDGSEGSCSGSPERAGVKHKESMRKAGVKQKYAAPMMAAKEAKAKEAVAGVLRAVHLIMKKGVTFD